MTAITNTYLEMTDAEQLRPRSFADPGFYVLEAPARQWRFNRFLYELVGADWDWTDKDAWSEEQWRAYVEGEGLRTFVVDHGGSPAGYFELSREGRDMEIGYFGLAPGFIGRGLGGALLTRALEEAWAMKPDRVWVHTCNLDHPAAVANYQARGMTVYKTETAHAR